MRPVSPNKHYKATTSKVAKDMDRKGLDVRSVGEGEWEVKRWRGSGK